MKTSVKLLQSIFSSTSVMYSAVMIASCTFPEKMSVGTYIELEKSCSYRIHGGFF
jgi:hypothetical protein